MTSRGVDMIAAERQRQVEVEGWDAKHDRGHGHEIAKAAVTYLLPPWQRVLRWGGFLTLDLRQWFWPWDDMWWKPKVPDGHAVDAVHVEARIRELVIAGALTAAAIDALLDETA